MRPQMKMVPPVVPQDLAGSPLDRVAANGPAAQFLYPALVKADGVEVYPPLTWQQPWFSPDSIMHWPLLLDIDRIPFGAWDRRVGQ